MASAAIVTGSAANGPTVESGFERARRRITRWRRVQVCGGLLLACTFFLPAVNGCGSSIIPYQVIGSLFTDPPGSNPLEFLLDVPLGLAIFGGAYAFGLLLAVACWRGQPTRSLSRVERIAGLVILLSAGALVVNCTGESIKTRGVNLFDLDMPEALFLSLALITPAYWFRSRRHGAGGLLAMRWYGSLCCVIWFAYWEGNSPKIGVHLALLGSALMLVGGFEEARRRSAQDRAGTHWRLLTAGLRACTDDPSGCAGCGYPLYGLVVPRCPECGLIFDPNRLASAAVPVTAP